MAATADEVPPARRRAERELLAMLIYQPALRAQPVALPEGRDATVTGLFQPRQFRDSAVRRVSEVVWAWLDDAVDFSVQQLMGELEDPRLRSLAADLYLEGERRLGEGVESAADHLRDLCASFDRILRREQYRQELVAYRQAGSEGDDALLEVLEQRRKQGYIPEAMPARVRVPQSMEQSP